MKKLFLIAIVAVFSFTATAQNFNVGVTVGLPSGDVSDLYTFSIGVDAAYLWEVSESFDAGVATGYNNFFGDEIGPIEIEDASFLPLAAAGRFNVSEEFVIGADLGYAIGINPDGNDGGFYYRPLIGYNLGANSQVTASYRGISIDGGATFSSINIGVNFTL